MFDRGPRQFSLATGATLFYGALILCAAPIVAPLVGLEPAKTFGVLHFFPGGDTAGWVSLALAVIIGTGAVLAFFRARRARRTLTVYGANGFWISLAAALIVLTIASLASLVIWLLYTGITTA